MSTYKDFYNYETVDFIAACPVEDCKNNNESYKWVHTKCGNYEKLNSKGILKCNNDDAIGCFFTRFTSLLLFNGVFRWS